MMPIRMLVIAALGLLSASCSNPDTGEQYTTAQLVAQVQAICITACNYEPDASAAAAMLTANNPTVVGVSAVAHAICHVVTANNLASAFGISRANAQEANTNCPESEKVNGVCVRGKKAGQ